VLLLDEPTSGLDAAASSHCMTYLHDLADAYNICVICTIHQPSTTIYNGFHKVLLLSRGKTAYLGSPSGSVEYFDKVLGLLLPPMFNPAEFLMDCINSEFTDVEKVESILDTWSDRSGNSETVHVTEVLEMPSAHLVKLSGLTQLYYVFRRQCYVILKDPMVYSGRAMMYLFMCIFFAIIYVNSRHREQDRIFDRLWISIWFMGTPTRYCFIIFRLFFC